MRDWWFVIFILWREGFWTSPALVHCAITQCTITFVSKLKHLISAIIQQVFIYLVTQYLLLHSYINRTVGNADRLDFPFVSVLFTTAEPPCTSAATHWSPAALHWSPFAFWCIGLECDAISLLRQKGQLQSPAPGHSSLTRPEPEFVITAEQLSQASPVAYGNSKSSVAWRLWTLAKGAKQWLWVKQGRQSGVEASHHEPRWQRTGSLHCHSVSRAVPKSHGDVFFCVWQGCSVAISWWLLIYVEFLVL